MAEFIRRLIVTYPGDTVAIDKYIGRAPYLRRVVRMLIGSAMHWLPVHEYIGGTGCIGVPTSVFIANPANGGHFNSPHSNALPYR
jgi:hypothetical protein